MRIPPTAALLMIATGLPLALALGPALPGDDSAAAAGVLASQPAEEGAAVAAAARSLVGAHELVEDGRRFNYDCSGTILAAYHRAGVRLYPLFLQHRGSGVRRLHELSEARQADLPVPGDMVFWDNTWDRNRNGHWDDALTHAGIVTAVDPASGVISFVHHDERRGIVEDHMNLARPDAPGHNAVMRAAGEPDHGGRIYAGQLYAGARSPYILAAP